jgi:adenine phosphoribosyltransferase
MSVLVLYTDKYTIFYLLGGSLIMDLKSKIRAIPDFPKPGILFKDITTLLQDGEAFHAAIDQLAAAFCDQNIDIVVGPEARGFVFGAPVAYTLRAGFVPVRKKGKLPAATICGEYALEYGKDTLEMHQDCIVKGQRVLVIDDLLATGGTLSATIKMVEQLGGVVVGIGCLIELTELGGRNLLGKYNVRTLIQY